MASDSHPSDVVQVIRAAAALTSSYVAGTVFRLSPIAIGFDLQLTLVKSSISSVEYIHEVSDDGGTTWFRTTSEEVAGGTATVRQEVGTIPVSGLSATDYLVISFDRTAYTYHRISFKETGTAGSNTLAATIRQIME